MPKITMTLQKTQKVLNDLKALKNKVNNVFESRYSSQNISQFVISTNNGIADLEKTFKDRQVSIKEAFDVSMAVNKSISETKKSLFKANISSGISDLMEEIARLLLDLQLFESVKRQTNLENMLTLTDITDKVFSKRSEYAESNGDYTISFNLSVIDFSPTDDEILTIKRQIIKLQEEKLSLNIQTTVEIDFPESIIKELLL